MGERVAKALSPVLGVEDLLDSQLPGTLAILAFLRLSVGWGGHHPLGHLKSLFPVLALVAFVFAENAMPDHAELDFPEHHE